MEVRALASDKKGVPDLKKGRFSVQVGAFSQKENADRLARDLTNQGHRADVMTHDRGDAVFFRVRVHGFTDLAEARRAEDRFRKGGYPGAMVVAE
ncbi:SPOR domain-containing protein [Desulfobotulus sp. H1]|uniref:SPOR domain-containing protein n=1 Tax=Desulfobotulus pelophilus TaxID=2823377 RepID=A0ABT3N987_9BACT|nr:SPOR domain-containing protein [Desulfobotulus pelophilus]